MKIHRRQLLAASVATILPLPAVRAQTDFPSRPIRLVISFPAGSTSDLIARRLGEHVAKSLGQPVVIESRPGAQGLIAARHVVTSPKDGYTLFLGTNSSHAANVYLVKEMNYDPIKDFTPITQFTINPLLLVVNTQLPVRNVQEFIRYAKERPGKLNFGIGNSGGLVATQLLKMQAGIDAVGVNYPGTAQAATDLVAGRLDFMMIDPLVIRPFIQGGKVRVLGLTSRERLASMPEAVPLAELGLVGFDYASWSGLFGPAGMPPEVTRRLGQAFIQAVKDPATVAWLADLGIIPAGSNPEAFQAYVADQIQVWGRLTKAAGLTAQ